MKRSITLFTLACCFSGLLFAGPVDKNITEAATAVALANTDAESAAIQVAQDNTARAGTLPWYQQSATQLLLYAFQMQSLQQDDAAKSAALAALKILAHGHSKAAKDSTPGDRAQTFVQMAQIYDGLLGDRANAEDCYNRALAEDPSDPIAKHGAAKMENEKKERGGK